jgi:hypothetical protein
MDKKLGRPLKGKENRKQVMIRLEPSEKEKLVQVYGGVQAAVDSLLKSLKKLTTM